MQLDLTKSWQIHLRDPGNPTCHLAARELSVFLQQICAKPILITDKPDHNKSTFELSCGKNVLDGFEWRVGRQRIMLSGSNPRGLLYAVYDFLETLGCIWFSPGMTGMSIPKGTHFSIKRTVGKAKSSLPGRCLILGHHAFMQVSDEWIIWAARNRINTIFFHVIDEPLAIGAAPETFYQQIKSHAVTLARERGMTVEHGGHKLTSLLPHSLFRRMPAAFRMRDGKRTNDHNFCPSDPAGLAVIRKNGRTWFESHPEVDIFHLWADDIPGGGWCECEHCRGLTPSDQLLMAINALAEVLEQVNPDAQISFLAYHDTEQPPQYIKPRQNVSALWAPRMRCYAHAIADRRCKVNNPKYRATFKDLVKVFDRNGARPIRVFEYYLDAILFKSILPPLIDVMQSDLKTYGKTGAHTVQALMTGDAPWYSPQLNTWLFARFAWNPRQDAKLLIKRFSLAAFNTNLTTYYRKLEKAYRLALDLVPEQIKMVGEEASLDVLQHPPVDMGDPFFASKKSLSRKVKSGVKIERLIKAAEAALESAANGNPLLARERVCFILQKAWLQFDCARVQLYRAVAEKNKSKIETALNKAKSSYQSVLAWGDTHISDIRHRNNFRMIHTAMWGLRLARIELDTTRRGISGLPLRLKTMLEMLTLLSKMRRCYEK
ncbi:MAG: DUF4838 domain-containing protein [Anaerolineaceae bacterium]